LKYIFLYFFEIRKISNYLNQNTNFERIFLYFSNYEGAGRSYESIYGR